MIEENEQSQSSSLSDDHPVIMHIPVKIGGENQDAFENNLTQGNLTYINPGDYSDNPEIAAREIAGDARIALDETLVEAVRCAGVWRALGAETLIYISTYGATLVANGLVIRFMGANVLMSSFLFNLAAVLGFHNAGIFFNSLLHPPKEEVPEEQKACFEIAKKYGLLPVSWLIRATLSASTTAFLTRDTSYSAQQVVSAITSAFVGPIMYSVRSGMRLGMKGTVTNQAKGDGVVTAFKTAYSSAPNMNDEERPYLWGATRDQFIRVIAMTSSTIVMAAINGFQLSTFCLGGREELNNITRSNRTVTFEDVEQKCIGGPLAFYLRDIGIAFIYGFAMMILEPILNSGLNRIFDYYYGPSEGDDDTQGSSRTEDVSDSDNPKDSV